MTTAPTTPSHLLIQIRFDNLPPSNTSSSNTALIPMPTPDQPLGINIPFLTSSVIDILINRTFGISKPVGFRKDGVVRTVWSVCWDVGGVLGMGGSYELSMVLERDEDLVIALEMMAVRGWRDTLVVDIVMS